MASGSFHGAGPPLFSGENYQIWAIKMKAYLKALSLWDVVETDAELPALRANPTLAQMKKHEDDLARKPRALTCIHSALSEVIFTRIMTCETPYEAWMKLKEEFEGSERVRAVKLLTLKREFELLRMKEEENIKDYSSKLLELVNKIRLYGEDFPDSKVVEKMLISLPARFEAKVSAIEESCDLKVLTVAELISKLQAQEQRSSIREGDVTEGAFQARQKGNQQAKASKWQKRDKFDKGKTIGNSKEPARKDNFPPCKTCQRTNHLEKDCWFKGKPPIECRFCKKLGHIEKYCRAKHNQMKANQPQQANFTEGEEELHKASLFMASQSLVEVSKHTWFIDSGCTSHMAKEEGIFNELDTSIKAKVKLGNGEIIEAQGRGSVMVETKEGKKLIHDVLFVPSLAQNLLSVAQMLQNNYSLIFKDKGCQILDPNGVLIAMLPMVDKCFPLSWKSVCEKASFAKIDESWLWHKRYGHFNFPALISLHNQGLTRDLPKIIMPTAICGPCQFGKQHRQAFPSESTWRAKEKLELVHSDVCGPMSIESLSNNRYFVLFIDDYTRMTWVYFVNRKSQVLSVFKKFKTMVEAQCGRRLKNLRSDNGMEYNSNEFVKYCEEMGIGHQLTVSYTPEQNGVSERKNRTVVEMAKSMLNEKSLPLKFWAEVVYTAVYLLNRLPTKAIEEMTPIEAWSGIKPSAKHLKLFGSICYIHVPAVKRTKLDKKSDLGIFLGYASQAKGYRIYNLQSKKITISRDVVFDEHSYWNWEKNIVEQQVARPQEAESIMSPTKNQNSTTLQPAEDEDEDEQTPRKTRTISEIYEKCNVMIFEPESYVEASKSKEWMQAMNEEIAMIEKNETWELVERPKGRNVIGLKWIYRTKVNPNGSIHKLKARLVAKGYAQQPGIDFGETFAPVARHDTIRFLVALAAQMRWKIFHLDVKSAFLNGELQEEIFVEQPEGFQAVGKEDMVYSLKKALYGLKQAPRAWYSKIDNYLTQCGFRRSENEATLYVRKAEDGKFLVVSLYVDDLLVTGSDFFQLKELKSEMEKMFEMSDLGEMKYFLGMEIHQCLDGIFISQEKYAHDMLKRFKMEGCKVVDTPLVKNEKLSKNDGGMKVDATLYRSLIGSLLYLTATRPDLMFSTSLLSRFMCSPSEVHLGAAKRVLRYVKGTCDYGIWFAAMEDGRLQGFSDSDWAGSVDDMKSTSGYAFSLGSGVFSWNSKKQEVVAQSSAEAEYIAAAAAANQAIWLRKVLEDLEMSPMEATVIKVDNKSAISMAQNPVLHGRSKHIKVKFHALRQAEQNKEIKLEHCKSEMQVADILTKALPKSKFEYLRTLLGVLKKNLKEEC